MHLEEYDWRSTWIYYTCFLVLYASTLIEMKKRLSLTVREDLIDQIKKYADHQETSISNIVEEHFQKLLTSSPQRPKVSLLEFVKGLPKSETDYPKDFDFQKEYYAIKAKEYDDKSTV